MVVVVSSIYSPEHLFLLLVTVLAVYLVGAGLVRPARIVAEVQHLVPQVRG